MADLRNSIFNLALPVHRDIVERPLYMAKAPKHLSVVELRVAHARLGVEYDAYQSKVHGLIVGQSPGPNTHWATPLIPSPARSSAGRLLAMSGMTPAQYLGGLYRRNLCDGKGWSEDQARKRARELVTALFDQPRTLRVILLGVKVAKCFGAPGPWVSFRLESRQAAVVVPHPSGMNHLYNVEGNRKLTGAWLRWAAIGGEEP